MKKFNLVIILILGIGITAFAQNEDSVKRRPRNDQAVSNSKIQTETNLAAQLQSNLDVKNTKVGDQIILKTESAVKQDGKIVIPKGANVIGHITEVQQKSKNSVASKISVVFDRLQGKNIEIPITASIVSITQVAGNANVDNMASGDLTGGSNSSGSASSGRSGGNSSGGLLSGVGNAVGGVTGAASNTVGGITNTAGKTVSGIRISQSLDVSANGSTTLSSNSNNLKLEKGVTFNLLLTEQTGN